LGKRLGKYSITLDIKNNMKEINELEKEIKRLKLANRMLDLIFTIIGITFLVMLYYIIKS
jgi:hypothetical protein